METKNHPPDKTHIAIIATGIIILIGLTAIIMAMKSQGQGSPTKESILERVKDSKTIRVGYASYPPYVIKDLNTGNLSGFYVDIMREMAIRAGWRIEWIETTWDTYISDLQTGKFDVMNDPIYHSVPRWKEVSFADQLGYFSGVAGFVRKEDTRFKDISDLNHKGISIAIRQGDTTEEYVKKNLPLATLKAFKGDSPMMAFSDVLAGNSDIALADGPSIQQYLEKNPDQYAKGLFLENPPAITPAGWAIRKGDVEWLLFLDGSIQTMKDDGTITGFAKRYKLYSYEKEAKMMPQ